MSGKRVERHVDQTIADLARRQHGVVSRAQLEAVGVAGHRLEHRVHTGAIHRIHRGVYVVGNSRLSWEGRLSAAVLALGAGAAVSHRTAAALWDLRRSDAPMVELTVPAGGGRARRAGIEVHRSTVLPTSEVTRSHGIPVTTPARTLLDLAAVVSRASLERAVAQAELLRRFDFRVLRAVLDAHPRRPGSVALRALLDQRTPLAMTRSELEERFLELCASAGLPRPLAGVRVGPYEVDFLWPRQRVIVETDGRRYHGTSTAFERDRERDARLTAAGYRVIRFTYRQIVRDPAYVVGVLRSLLGPSER